MDPQVLDWARQAYPAAVLAAMSVAVPTARPDLDHLGDPGAEYAALTQHAGLVITPGRAPLLVDGGDAASYLHRRLSQSIQTLGPGRGAHTLQLAGDGRMQSDLLVYRAEDAFIILTPEEFAAADAALLERTVINDDVAVEPLGAAEATVALAGPAAPELLRSLLDHPIAPEQLDPATWPALFTVTLRGFPCRVFGDARWRVPWYHLTIPHMAAGPLLRELDDACRRVGGQSAGRLAVELVRIESGIPRFGLDTDDHTIPLEAGLRGALSTDKGCYPGQEVIARILNLGHPARQLVRLTVEGDPAPGNKVEPGVQIMHDGQETGKVTSAVTWPGLGRTTALGYLKWADREAARVEIKLLGEGWAVARVAPLEAMNH